MAWPLAPDKGCRCWWAFPQPFPSEWPPCPAVLDSPPSPSLRPARLHDPQSSCGDLPCRRRQAPSLTSSNGAAPATVIARGGSFRSAPSMCTGWQPPTATTWRAQGRAEQGRKASQADSGRSLHCNDHVGEEVPLEEEGGHTQLRYRRVSE